MPLSDCIRKTNMKNVDIIPANNRMEVAEQSLPVRLNYALILRDALQKAHLSYSFVLLDCPPALGAVALNALSASNLLIVPTQAEYFLSVRPPRHDGTNQESSTRIQPQSGLSDPHYTFGSKK